LVTTHIHPITSIAIAHDPIPLTNLGTGLLKFFYNLKASLCLSTLLKIMEMAPDRGKIIGNKTIYPY